MNIFIAVLITAIVAYPAGYFTCFFWGKSRKAIKNAAGTVAEEVEKVAEEIERQ